jgi:hypothetical protein
MSDNLWGVWVPIGGMFLLALGAAWLIFWAERRRYLKNPPPWLLKR